MKKTFITMLALCGLLLTGCANLVDLSEKENNILGQYMSNTIIEHTEYNTLLSMKDLNMEVMKEESNKTEIKEEEGEHKAAQIKDSNDIEGKTTNVSLTKAVGKSNFDIKYKTYKFHDKFPTTENNYFELYAGENEKLLVVYFDVKNLSNKTLRLDLVEEGIRYHLEAEGTTLNPMLTLLMDDIQYINLDIKAKSTNQAVLVFSVNNDIDLSNARLVINREENTTIINLK